MSAAEALARVTADAERVATQAEPEEATAQDEPAAETGGAAKTEPPAAAESAETVEPPPGETAAETDGAAKTEPPATAESAETVEPPPSETAAETDATATSEPPAPAPAEGAETVEPPSETAAETDATATSEPPAPAPAEGAETVEPPSETAAETDAAAATEPPTPAPVESAETERAETTELPAPAAAEATESRETGRGEPATGAGAAEEAAAGAADGAAAKPARSRKRRRAAKPETPPPDRPELRVVYEALANRQPLEGRVIGWNSGGFHLALGELAAFCPRSEMEVGEIQEPESYLDRTFEFRVLRLQGKGRRIVVSRAAHLRREKSRQRNVLRKRLKPGAVLEGTVASLKDFGAFVDLGGAQGLVHVSEISHRRVEHPEQVLSEGQQVQVKVLKVEQGGRRISLSLRALEPDPWKDLADRFPRGAVVKGTVEKATQIGAFIELAPGLTGLLPAKSMSIPRETSPARAYPPGKEVSVQIVAVDPRRQRISLALEGSGLEGSRTDYKEYQRRLRESGDADGFNALASAFRRLRNDD